MLPRDTRRGGTVGRPPPVGDGTGRAPRQTVVGDERHHSGPARRTGAVTELTCDPCDEVSDVLQEMRHTLRDVCAVLMQAKERTSLHGLYYQLYGQMTGIMK